MRRFAAGLCLCAIVAAQRPPDDGRAFVEVTATREAWFVRQPFTLTLRFGVEMGFLRTQVIQPFQRRLDVPVRLESPWRDGLPGAVDLTATPAAGRSCVLDGQLGHAQELGVEERQGRLFVVHAITRSFAAADAGELTVPAPHLRLDYATRFREDFVTGRVPEDRQVLAISGASLTLRIEPLPADGRPSEFAGAVGRFGVHADAEPHTVAIGQSVRLVLTIEAQGVADLTSFPVPKLDELTGFHVFGHLDESTVDRRTITYDITPLSTEVTAVPAITFRFFDPDPPGAYRETRTRTIPLAVTPAPTGAVIADLPDAERREPLPGVNDIYDLLPFETAPSAPSERALTPITRVGVLLTPWLLCLCLFGWRRVRRRREGDAAARHARRAAAAFRARAGEVDAHRVFAEYLAARLGRDPATVIAPDLPDRLIATGLRPELAASTGALMAELLAARYSRNPVLPDLDRALHLIDALEAAFRQQQVAT